MSNNKNIALFDLIKALDGSEKAYFSLRLNLRKTDKIIYELFKIIDKQDTFSDDQAFIDSGLNNISNYRVQKVHLYNAILREMRQYHSIDRAVDTSITNSLGDIKFLLSKKLFVQCQILIARMKKVAYCYQRYIPLIELLSIEHAILYEQGYSTDMEAEVDRINTESKKLSQYVSEYFDLKRIEVRYQTLISGQTHIRPKGHDRMAELNQLHQNPIFNDSVCSHLFEAELIRFFLYALKEEERVSSNPMPRRRELVQLYKSFWDTINDTGRLYLLESLPRKYFAFLYNYIRWVSNLPENEVKAKVEAIQLLKDANFASEKDKRNRDAAVLIQLIILYYNQGDSNGVAQTLSSHSQFLKNTWNKVDTVITPTLCAQVAHGYLLIDDVESAELWLRRVLDFSERCPTIRVDIVVVSYLVLTLLYARIERKSKVSKYAKEARAFMEQKNISDKPPKELIISFSENYVHRKTPAEGKKLRNEFIDEFAKISGGDDGELFRYFQFAEWVESFNGIKTFAQIIGSK